MQNLILYFTTVMIWGSTWFAVKFQIGEVPVITSLMYRFAIGAACLFVFLAIVGKLKKLKFSLRQHGYIALQGVLLFSVNYWFVYKCSEYLTSGLVAVVFASVSMMNAFNQAIFFKIPLRRQVIIGNMIGLLGMVAIFYPDIMAGSGGSEMLLGVGLGIVASYLASLGNMASLRNTREGLPVLEVNAVGMVYGSLFSAILVLVSGASVNFDMSPEYVGSLLYLAVFGSALAFTTYLTLLKNIGADKAAYATILFPIVALTISTFFENYQWTIAAVAGLALVVVGNVIAMANRENLLHWRARMAKKVIPDA